MKIALDAMGGDFAPDAVIEGVGLALKEFSSDITIVLTGKSELIKEKLNQFNISSTSVEIVDAPEVIEMGEHPTKALSQKPNSSISIGFGLLKMGKVQAFCSAGNTGAMMVGALFSVKAIEGILRPALVSFVPKEDGNFGVLIDVGANADCKPEQLVQFGQMGSIYAKYIYEIENPAVGLMNLGEEEQKGTVLTQAAYQLLKNTPNINFVGNIEGRDLYNRKADVIVCDGFTGNVILKMAENMYDILAKRNIVDPFFEKFNYEKTGGSPILGVNGNVIIGHGVSSGLAIKNMIHQCVKMIESDISTKIKTALNQQTNS
jgi:glycerol-3-phosphate acyltransferase PlsX